MAKLAVIENALSVAFPNVSNFILQSVGSEHVVDTPAGYSTFSSSHLEAGFDVNNPKGRTFDLLQIDNKLLVAQKDGQCDCAFFYDNDFNLLEFKTNAISPKKVGKNYNKAEKQLRNTVKIFRAKGIDLWSVATNVSAHICFSNSFPRKKASEMNRALLFAADKDTKGIGLYFENSKTL